MKNKPCLSPLICSFTLMAAAISLSHALGAERKVPTIAVAKSESSIPSWQPAIGDGLANMMITELSKLGNVQVLESVALGDLREERGLGEQGEVSTSERIKKGDWKGAEYTFKTVITRFGNKESSFGGGGFRLPVPFIGGGSFAVNKKEHEVQIDWRIIDNATRVAVKSGRGVGMEKGTGFSFSSWQDHGFSQSSEFMDSALGKATMKAIASIAEDLRNWAPPAKSGRDEVAERESAENQSKIAEAKEETRRVKGEILLVEDGKVWVSLGSEQGFRKGEKLNVYKTVVKKNKQGKAVATDYELAAEIELNKVQKDRSCAVFSGSASFEEGWSVALASVDINDLK